MIAKHDYGCTTEGNIGKNSRTARPPEVIRFDQISEINELRAEKVDRTGLMGSREGDLWKLNDLRVDRKVLAAPVVPPSGNSYHS